MTRLQPLAYSKKSDRSRDRKGVVHTAIVFLLAICITGCARAPSFDILGSFFPAWLMCLAVGLLLSFAAHWLLSRAGIVIAVPILTYPCLTALFTCALWLAFQ
jgi:NhaP-type Na+/H+ or K+/H+ antiporter